MDPSGRAEMDPFPRREVVIRGHRVAYRIAGSGPPLVLIHGLFDSSETWRRLVKHLSGRYTVIAPDLLGHGDSEAPTQADYSPTGHAIFVRDVLDALGYDRVLVGGWSFGGAVAIAFASTFPWRTQGLVLVAPAAGIDKRPTGMFALLATPLGPALAWLLTRRPLWTLICRAARANAGVRSLQATLEPLRDRDARRASFRTMHICTGVRGHRVSAADRVPTLAPIPVLIVWGAKDRVISAATGRAFQRLLPAIRLEIIADGGHLIHRQQARAVAERFVAFGDELAATAMPSLRDDRPGRAT